MNARTSATRMTISHQYSRIRSIESPIPLQIVTTAKLDEIGEQQPEKEAQHGDRGAFEDQRQSSWRLRPLRAADSGDLAEQPRKLAPLPIVQARVARKDQAAREGAV